MGAKENKCLLIPDEAFRPTLTGSWYITTEPTEAVFKRIKGRATEKHI
jgi:hypothetical protein